MALSPFPNDKTAAVAKLRRVVLNLKDDERAAELGELAAALIEEYAPGAPQAVKDEAAIRFVGYLAESIGPLQSVETGSVKIEFAERATSTANHAAMFQHCGAKALLTRWKVRRGGVIG